MNTIIKTLTKKYKKNKINDDVINKTTISNNRIVEYGNATKLTKGRGGRNAEAGYTRP